MTLAERYYQRLKENPSYRVPTEKVATKDKNQFGLYYRFQDSSKLVIRKDKKQITYHNHWAMPPVESFSY